MNTTNDQVLRQLTRQLKILNFWITLFGTLIVAVLLVLAFLTFKIVTFAHDTQQKVSDIQQKTTQTLNVKDDICKNNLFKSTEYCSK